ncbi:MAG: hypothetical protein WCO96_02670 [Actinomycetes bacterium]
MKLRRGVLAALAALMVAAPTAFASDDPAVDPTGVECVAADGGTCTDPGGSVEDPPSTGGDDQGDKPGDPGASDGDQGDGGGDSSGGGTTSGDNDDPTSGDDGSDPGTDGGDKPICPDCDDPYPTVPCEPADSSAGDVRCKGDPTDIDLCTWEPWNCGGDPGPGECNSERIAKRIPCYIVDPPLCDPNTPHGSKICLPYPTDPLCKVDPETGEQYCWSPPELCLTARFASEADAAAAGCLPPPCTVAEDGTVDCGGPVEPICPDCENPYPPPFCDYADGADGGFYCGGPPPCFIDDEGNKVCAVYDFLPDGFPPGETKGGDDGTVGVCVIGVDSPCNAKPEPRKGKGKKGGKAKGGVKAGPKKGSPGPKRGSTKPSEGVGSGKGTSPKGKGKGKKAKSGKTPKRKSPGASNPKGQTPKKSGAKKPKRSAKR